MKKTKKELDVAIRKIENEIKSELGKEMQALVLLKNILLSGRKYLLKD